jgi:hypothetical protein
MLKTVALIGAGIAIGCCYKSYKNDPQKSKCKSLKNCDKSDKAGNEALQE